MGAIEHLTISLPVDLADELRHRVAAGEFADLDEAVLEGLRALGGESVMADDNSAAFRANVCAAYDAWRADPADVVSLGDAIDRIKRESRSRR